MPMGAKFRSFAVLAIGELSLNEKPIEYLDFA